ncbi:OB-fold nucleic acid binding domain-containing protein [Thermofilum pendens]|uniref:Nucleic acid binding, OB-fold, tRNA/helicase-type n=1 Tax=Thermofilum pendens (strain DSM 2475 / Hrk 5) TaxID=368408 RepID=A1RX77_THEPD|nr:OB-fold nucleic acid binding domain-containing protein [Thermofilum pendens]ABL77807.1 nucleic acid binding, OB-fold, tRNA/helicase-type [Thermofilum pendens Hrk 5]
MGEGREGYEILLDCFLKALPSEVVAGAVKRGSVVYFRVVHGKAVLMSRKIAVVGRVQGVVHGDKFTDIVLGDGSGTVTVRFWSEKKGLLEDKGLAEGSTAKVLGVLRESREGTVYVTPIAVQSVPDGYLEEFTARIREDRDFLATFIEKQRSTVDAEEATPPIGRDFSEKR